MRRASVTCFPRIRSATRRAFLGETRTNFAIAFASISYPSARRCHQSSQCSCSLQRGAALGVVAVGPEDRGAARPRPDDALGSMLVHVLHTSGEMIVHERTLLHGPWHGSSSFPFRGGARCIDRTLSPSSESAPPSFPTGLSGADLPRPFLHRHRADGRRGSWPRPGPWVSSPATWCVLPFPTRSARVPDC